MRIAIDAMGGDFAPSAIVAGAVEAVRELPAVNKIILVGSKEAIEAEFKRYGALSNKIELVHTAEAIGMDEPPLMAVRRKKDSSINRAVDLLKSGEADALISAGNTGAVVTSVSLKLRRLPGIERPAITAVIPTPEKPFVLIDAGANTDCSANLLYQFAVMGSVYSREILHQSNPVAGLMSVGTEKIKGNETTKEAYRLLDESSLNFKGNIEGHDLYAGKIDVAVCDGFVGNVVLKTSESVAMALGTWIKREFTENLVRKAGTLLLSGALRVLRKRLNPNMYGGAPLLGANGVCIICHGRASAQAFFHAIRVASDSVSHDINHIITDIVARSKRENS